MSISVLNQYYPRLMSSYVYEISLIERIDGAQEIGGATALADGNMVDLYSDRHGCFATLSREGRYISAVAVTREDALSALDAAHKFDPLDPARTRALLEGILWGRKIPLAIAPVSWIED